MASREDIITYLVSWFFYFQSAFNKLRIYFGKYMREKLGFELYRIVTRISQLIGRPGAYTDLRPSAHQFTLPGEDCPRWLACPAILYLIASRWPMPLQHLWKSCETISDSAAHWCTSPIHHFDFNLIFALILTCSHIYIPGILVCWRSFNYKAWYYWTFHIWRLAIHLPDESSKTHRESEEIWQFPPRWCRRSYLRQSR